MQVYRYTQKRIVYYYLLVLSCIDMSRLISLFTGTEDPLIVLQPAMGLVFLIAAIRGLREKVVIRSDSVTFTKLFSVTIPFVNMESIKVNDKNKFCFQVKVGKRTVRWNYGVFESDADIVMFKLILADLINQARAENPEVQVDAQYPLTSDTLPGFIDMQYSAALERRATLSGLGGVLFYIGFLLIADAVVTIVNGIDYVSSLVQQSDIVLQIPNLINLILCACALVFLLIVFLQFARKNKKFKVTYIILLIYMTVYDTITAFSIIFLSNETVTIASCVGLFSIVAVHIVWIFAWKEYLRRSTRVKNTFIR